MPIGTDDASFRITASPSGYTTFMILPSGRAVANEKSAVTKEGLSWESPNSGGGTWVYRVRLVTPDSMSGTIVLRDAPANLTPAPRGTLSLTRRDAGTRRR